MFTVYLRSFSTVALFIFYSLHISAMERDNKSHKRKRSYDEIALEKKFKSEKSETYNQISKAIEEVDIDAFKKILDDKPDLNWTPSKKQRPFLYDFDSEPCLVKAARIGAKIDGTYWFVDELINHSAKPDCQTLMAAIEGNHEDLALQLLDRIPTAQLHNVDDICALASKNGMPNICEQIKTGKASDFDSAYCQEVIKAGNVDALATYLAHKQIDAAFNPLNQIFSIEVNGTPKQFTLLTLACSNFTPSATSASMVKTLLAACADPNFYPQQVPCLSALGMALNQLRFPCIKELVDASADIFVVGVHDGERKINPLMLISQRLVSQIPTEKLEYYQIKPFLLYLKNDAIFLPRYACETGNEHEKNQENPNTTLKAMCVRTMFKWEPLPINRLNMAAEKTSQTLDDLAVIAFIPKSGKVTEMIDNVLRVPESDRATALKVLVDVLAKTKYAVLARLLRYPGYIKYPILNDIEFSASEYPRLDEVDEERVRIRNARIESIKRSLAVTLGVRVAAQSARRSQTIGRK